MRRRKLIGAAKRIGEVLGIPTETDSTYATDASGNSVSKTGSVSHSETHPVSSIIEETLSVVSDYETGVQ